MALKAVVTTNASSATMHDAIEASANTQDFFAFSLNSGVLMIMSSRLQFKCPCREDERGWPKDSAEKKFLFTPHPSAGPRRLQGNETAANGACYETDRGTLQDETRDSGRERTPGPGSVSGIARDITGRCPVCYRQAQRRHVHSFQYCGDQGRGQ